MDNHTSTLSSSGSDSFRTTWLLGGGLRWLDRQARITMKQERKLGGYLALGKLSRMLQNTLRNWPLARVVRRKGGYGVSLAEETYLRVSYSSDLTLPQQRDLLALLATLLVADPDKLIDQNTPPGG